jgi:8-oxo-dGTP pyrophosphatase MutT (NUDIX family)
MPSVDNVPRPAATVILLREALGELQVLLVRRARELAVHAGAWVFPGGSVDRQDLQDGDVSAAARRAAVREAQEEAGIQLSEHALLPFSHWTTPEGVPRRFATAFFLARTTPDIEVQVDGGEIRAHRWLVPQAALASAERGELTLPPPTFVSLATLAKFATWSEVLGAVQGTAPEAFFPRRRKTGDNGRVMLYHGDAAYEGAEVEAAGPRHRLYVQGHSYRYERSL